MGEEHVTDLFIYSGLWDWEVRRYVFLYMLVFRVETG